MNITIHRGTDEIGGSCVEMECGKTRILVDIGMPLVNPDKTPFDFKKYAKMSGEELIEAGILPNVPGLYPWDDSEAPHGILISHAHPDHYGFMNYAKDEIPVYMSFGTQAMIKVNTLVGSEITMPPKLTQVEAGVKFTCGDFTILPVLADHSGFDALSFIIDAVGKRVVYSGDLRSHGRKGDKTIDYLKKRAGDKVDALLLEGTMLGRDDKVITEVELESQAVELFKATKGPVLIRQSGQNIDRIVSFYKAAKRTGRIFVVDIYVANVLRSIQDHPKVKGLPQASKDFPEIRVFYPRWLTNRMMNSTDASKKAVYAFRPFKLIKEEIAEQFDKVVLLVRESFLPDVMRMAEMNPGSFKNGLFLYSMWEGYKKESKAIEFLDFVKKCGMKEQSLHTSGHASVETLKDLLNDIRPKTLIPIHTFYPERFKEFYADTILPENGEQIEI